MTFWPSLPAWDWAKAHLLGNVAKEYGNDHYWEEGNPNLRQKILETIGENWKWQRLDGLEKWKALLARTTLASLAEKVANQLDRDWHLKRGKSRQTNHRRPHNNGGILLGRHRVQRLEKAQLKRGWRIGQHCGGLAQRIACPLLAFGCNHLQMVFHGIHAFGDRRLPWHVLPGLLPPRRPWPAAIATAGARLC